MSIYAVVKENGQIVVVDLFSRKRVTETEEMTVLSALALEHEKLKQGEA